MRSAAGTVRAVDGVSFAIKRGETFGLVGESGCGKTTLGKLLLGLAKPDAGEVIVETQKVQAVFQDPLSSLDPTMRVEEILSEGLVIKREICRTIREKVIRALDLVHLPQSALKKYPHQFSGGERQRIAIGRAIVTDPEFIVCDEPVSSLDVTIQLEILRLLKEIQERLKVTYLFISHDLRVIRFMAQRVAVMKEGRIVEEGFAQDVYQHPAHPYTRQLLSALPK